MYTSQSIHFIGLLRKDPALIYTPNGNPIFKATITVYDTVKINSERKNVRAYVPIRAYGIMAETAIARVRRGCWIAVNCRYRTSMFTNKAGKQEMRNYFDINGFDLIRLPGQNVHDFPETTDEISKLKIEGSEESDEES